MSDCRLEILWTILLKSLWEFIVHSTLERIDCMNLKRLLNWATVCIRLFAAVIYAWLQLTCIFFFKNNLIRFVKHNVRRRILTHAGSLEAKKPKLRCATTPL